MKSLHSDFWLDSRASNVDVLTGESVAPSKDYHKLAATKRAIANFVNIVTGKSIPVVYSTNSSYTDGDKVVISSNIKDDNFDPTVGLALHEGSHCLLTDFNVLSELKKELATTTRSGHVVLGPMCTTRYEEIKDLLNYVEDRRIDYFIYTTAPGYKAYYKAMYKKYFDANVITKALKSADKREVTRENYMFRIINFTNIGTDLDALPGLRDIWNILDLRNIKRLKSTAEALVVARQIDDIINEQLAKVTPQEDDSSSDEVDRDTPEDGEGKGTGSDADNQSGGDDDGSTAEGSDAVSSNDQTDKDLEPLNDRHKKQLDNAIRKQKQFMDGEIKKSKISQKDQSKVEALESAGVETQEVGGSVDRFEYYGRKAQKGVECMVIKNSSVSLAESDLYSNVFYFKPHSGYAEFVPVGVRLGTMLGRKLQVRNEDSTLLTTRLRNGKLDRRLVASLGFGAEAVFSRLEVDKFKPAVVHISIDASGSMGGPKWAKTQTAAIAIAKAASMTSNLDVVISYRTCELYGNQYSPCIAIAYDSTKDNLRKFLQLIPYIRCSGSTPEGLCYEATSKEIIKKGNGKDAYLINFSDGCPGFGNHNYSYYGEPAIKHTRNQIENIKKAGIKVLSYFINDSKYVNYYSSSGPGQDELTFKEMYGKDAVAVNPTQIMPLAKSLNKRFATK